MKNTKDRDGIDETEVWQKFSATHSYQEDFDGTMRLISSKILRLDPFGIDPAVEISKAELITELEPKPTIT